MRRYSTPWEFNKLKNSLKSGGSSTSIVDTPEDLNVAETVLAGLGEPVGLLVGLVEERYDRKGSFVQLEGGRLVIAHRSWCPLFPYLFRRDRPIPPRNSARRGDSRPSPCPRLPPPRAGRRQPGASPPPPRSGLPPPAL